MDNPAKDHARSDRKLRVLSILMIVPAFGLLIASSIWTESGIPGIGLIPMSMSSSLSAACLFSKGWAARRQPAADFIMILCLLIVMIPRLVFNSPLNIVQDCEVQNANFVLWLIYSWIFLAEDYHIDRRIGMLCSYGMMPMIVNLYVRHFLRPQSNDIHSTNTSSCIHIYLFTRSIPSLFAPKPCPNCNHVRTSTSILPRWQKHVALPHDHNGSSEQTGPGHSRSSREIYRPFMRAYGDEDARESSEFQTSGFNTPRQSADTLHGSVRASGEGHGHARGEQVDVKEVGNLV